MTFNNELLSQDIKEKQKEEGKFSKQVQKEIGISSSAFNTLVNGASISLITFTKCLEWLQENPNKYLN